MASEFVCTGDLSRFDLNFPNFSQPNEIGTFSVDARRKFCNDDRNLKYFCPPKVNTDFNFDLSVGHQNAIHKLNSFGNEKLDFILQYILTDKQRLTTLNASSQTPRLMPHFVCYRGLLTTLLCTPYETNAGWIIYATKYRGTIYMFLVDTKEELARKAKASKRANLMSYWGFKFEQYVTADTPESVPNTSVKVNENEEYCSVCMAKLNSHRILFVGEVDCVRVESRDSKSTDRYVELKTSRIITSERQDVNFRRFKLLKWWAQSFVIGISEIVCGFRDDDGFVTKLQSFDIRDIPKMANKLWEPCICFNFCDQFLSFVQKSVMEDGPKVVYNFEWSPNKNVRCEVLDDPRSYEILPDWFIMNVFNL